MNSNYSAVTQAHQRTSEWVNDWASLGRVAMLERWADELRQIVEAGTADAASWRMVGRAALLVQADMSASAASLKQVAASAGLKLQEATPASWLAGLSAEKLPAAWSQSLLCISAEGWDVVNGDPALSAARANLAALLAGLSPDAVVVFVTCVAEYENMPAAMRAPGIFDRRFVVPAPSLDEIGQKFIDDLGRDKCDASLLEHAGKVGQLIVICFDDPRRLGLIELAMQRLAWREKRRLNFADLVQFAAYGSEESDRQPEPSGEQARRVAIHEAGHALVSIIDSAGQNMPEYVSILPRQDCWGIVVESYRYHYDRRGSMSYRDTRQRVRIALAGRAAEELVLGMENISSQASRNDLIQATHYAKDLVGYHGFPSNLEDGEFSRANLLCVEQNASASESAHMEAEARLFLTRQYLVTLQMIRQHRPLLETIIEHLLAQHVLGQDEIARLWERTCAATPIDAP